MKAKNLHEVWSAADNSRLTSKQYSFRLPVHVAAKIQALCDMYPKRTRTEIVADLLAAALSDMELGFPSIKGAPWGEDENGDMLYEDVGPAMRFRSRTDHHYIILEKELGTENPEPFYGSTLLINEKDIGK